MIQSLPKRLTCRISDDYVCSINIMTMCMMDENIQAPPSNGATSSFPCVLNSKYNASFPSFGKFRMKFHANSAS